MGFRPLSIRRNIWLLYKLLCATAVIALAGLTYAHWQYLTAQTEASQRSLVKQWFGSFSSLLEQQETIITLIGQDILLRQREGNPDIRSELDRLMNINPEFFAGFALFSTAGEVLDTTSNLVRPDPPNLLQQPESKDSFVYAIESDKMVLGRTYNAPRLVIPARKAIRDTDGQLLGFEQICIEVTENLLIEDIEQIHHILTRAKDAGVRMSLDDFGTGYSSLSTLRSLPFHEVKIDKSFVDHVTDDKTALAMVQNIIAIGQNYGMTVLAEGVETEEQLQCLITCGCDHFQGYLFARPLALDDLRACIARESLSPTQ